MSVEFHMKMTCPENGKIFAWGLAVLFDFAMWLYFTILSVRITMKGFSQVRIL